MRLSFRIRVIMIVPLLVCTLSAVAQKLPNIQYANVPVTTNKVKIDGHFGEWGDQYAAFNKTVRVFYTIANDDKNLYLVLGATDNTVAKKIIVGGVTFTIGNANEKSDQGGSSVTFPFYDKSTPSWYIDLDAPNVNPRKGDSLLTSYNRTIGSKFKTIGIRGFTPVVDSVLSIYNEAGIKVAAKFDREFAYCYELAIPLKLLGVSTNDTNLRYNIRLNGIPIHGTNLQLQTYGRDIISYRGANGALVQVGKATPEMIALVLPTDFSGQYNIALK